LNLEGDSTEDLRHNRQLSESEGWRRCMSFACSASSSGSVWPSRGSFFTASNRRCASLTHIAMSKEPKIGDEIKRMEHEPLLPVEKRLIVWSLLIGLALLGLLVWMSGRLFPG
jgi:hypothetical protein